MNGPVVSDRNASTTEIPRGASICFTGSFVDGSGNSISKCDLEALATEYGYTVVGNVTKTKCDIVVAVDPNSASGKAKQARKYGKPIIAANRFIQLLQSDGT